jgi:hypothetical protein
LKENGQAFHHLCYEVNRLEEALAELRSKGALIAKPLRPAVAFEGRRIAWLLTAEKLLLECCSKLKRASVRIAPRGKKSSCSTRSLSIYHSLAHDAIAGKMDAAVAL